MKTIEKTYKIELSEEEIRAITTALQGEQIFLKGEITKEEITSPERKRLVDKRKLVRELRNGLGNLVNMAYMGEDA